MGTKAREVIKRLKELFTKAPILVYFDLEKKIVIKTDALGYAIAAVISQSDDKGKLRLVVYYLRKMTLLETNYEIYDIELLVIIKVIRE